MGETRVIFFWMGGVVTQALEPLLRQALASLAPQGVLRTNLLAAPGFAAQCEAFTLGQVSDLDFCQAVAGIAGLDVSPAALRDAAVAGLAAAPGVIREIDRLPRAIERWLIVDYPQAWFDAACDRLAIDPCFAAENRIFLDRSRLPRLVPDVFDALAQAAHLPLEACLVVDAQSRRAVAALDRGFPAAIFVDARRLEREFVMRRFTARQPLEHRPETVIQQRLSEP
jgi:hypothetical protein